MARSITASVGRLGGVNRAPDVVTVQQLLNRVPRTEGGPLPPLEVDGLCGPITIKAIQTFQLHHFGFRGADGRVDPDGPTLRKLNEFDQLVQGTRTIRGVLLPGAFLDQRNPNHWFFEIADPRQPGMRAVYHLGPRLERPPLVLPLAFLGERVEFFSARTVSEFATRGGARYVTAYRLDSLSEEPPLKNEDRARVLGSRLELLFLADPSSPGTSGFENLIVGYPAHIEPPTIAELSNPFPPTAVRVVRTKGDTLKRVR